MKPTEFENQLDAYVMGELSIEEVNRLKEAAEEHSDYQQSLLQAEQLMAVMSGLPKQEPSERLRSGFFELLEEEKRLQTPVRSLSKPANPWKTAFQIAASVLILVAGYSIGKYTESQSTSDQISSLREESEVLKQNVMMALIENRSASKRIQAVNYSEEIQTPDTQLLDALVARMQFDRNINVRLAAAEALSRFSENQQVKDAFIEALTIEKEPNIQIAIIQFLVKAKDQRARVPMQQLLDEIETPGFVKDQVNAGLSTLM